MSQMLYKSGNMLQWHGMSLDYVIVPESAIDSMLAEGWHLHPCDIGSEPVSSAAPTRAELEQKARELSLKFDGRTTDAKLAKLIEDALK